jgi:hypothetical protein
MRSLLLIESLDFRPSNQYILVSESPSCLRLEKNVRVPGKRQSINNRIYLISNDKKEKNGVGKLN